MANNTPIQSALNLGPASSAWLAEVGIHTLADLKKVGPVVAYQMVKMNQGKASLNLLYALHGALIGERWNQLTETVKESLTSEAIL